MKNENYSIFLDDERKPERIYPKNTRAFMKKMNMIVCRTYDDAVKLVEHKGKMPSYVSFDNDLGQDWKGNVLKEGKDFAEWLIEADLDHLYSLPENFSFFVHSANIVQSESIEIKLSNYMKFKYPNWENSNPF